MKKGWEEKKLREVCDIVGGGTPSKSNKDFYKGDILWATVRDMKADVLSDTEFRINESAVRKSATNIIPKGNIIIATRVGLGKVCILKNDTAINQDLKGVIPKRGLLNTNFLFYLFKILGEEIIKHGTGATVQGVKLSFIENIEIPFPPLPQQKPIVAILDKAFTTIDKAKANTQKNLQNAKALFESYLQKMFEEKGEDWEEKKLGDVCHIIGGGTPSKDNKRYYTGNIYWSTVRDMKNDRIVDTEYKITDEAVKQSATNIIPKGNVVIATRVGLGKACLLIHDTAINQDLKGVIPKKGSNLSVEFLFRWFKCISKQIIEAGTGATVQGVKLTFINSLIISYPSFKKQKRIIESIDQVEKETQKLILNYQQKLTSLEELKKSILQKAFSGQLTAAKLFEEDVPALSVAAEPESHERTENRS